MAETVIKIENLKKRYRLGAIGGGTLSADLQSWWAKKRGREDPNTKIGENRHQRNETFWALNGIDLEIKKGEALGIIGANGAGKSTLLKILSRVTAPTEGDVYIKGRITSMLEVGTGFHPEMTGRENIYMNGAILGMNRREVDKKINDIIEFSECAQFIDTPVKRYSSGMYVKLAFSVASHLDSEIMIMDEVLAVGDVSFQRKCLNRMRKLAQSEGRTVLYVSHNMATIKQLCDRTIVMNKGKVVYDGKSDKAIEVYGGDIIKMQVYNTFDYPRNDQEITEDVKVKSLEVLGCDNNYIMAGEKLCFKLVFNIARMPRNLYMRFIITDIGKDPVASSMSSDLMQMDVKEECTCILDISCLAPGKYIGELVLFEIVEKGIQKRHDYISRAVSFEIVQDSDQYKSFDWNIHWGRISLPDISVQK